MPLTNTNNEKVAKKQYFFPLLAFIVPLLVRAIPEVIAGQYILGFDTMAFYVPNTLLWQHGGTDLWSYLATAPLFYTILISIVSTGVPILVVLKVIPTLLLGFLSLSIYFYARKGLGWSPFKSLLPALLGTIYFVALRISWDMLRNELGLIFFFFVLTLLSFKGPNSLKHYLLLSFVMMTVVLSHQLVAVIMLGTILFTLSYRVLRKETVGILKLVLITLPSIIFFFIVYFVSVAASGLQDFSASNASPLATWLGFNSYSSMVVSEAGFFLYCFLPLLPLIIISLKRFNSFQMRSWLLLSLILILIPFAFVSPYRWLIMLMYPLAFYVTDALASIRSLKCKKYRNLLFYIAAIYLVMSTAILSAGYIATSTERPFAYFDPEQFNGYLYQIPSSMLQNTIAISDCKDVTNVFSWFNDNVNNTSFLLTHTVFYSWAMLAINNSQIIHYGFADPDDSAATAFSAGDHQIYLIWWTSGHGWYGRPTLPSTFQQIYYSGEIALYLYAEQ